MIATVGAAGQLSRMWSPGKTSRLPSPDRIEGQFADRIAIDRLARALAMSDTYTLTYRNFRSLEDVTLEVAPLTVIYGPNGSGKSSLIYGLLTLRSFLTNPNQNIPSLFAYPSISLGGHQEVVHRHWSNQSIYLSIGATSSSELSSEFAMTLFESGGAAGVFFEQQSIDRDNRISSWPSSLNLGFSIPYQANRQANDTFTFSSSASRSREERDLYSKSIPGTLLWNGISIAAQLNDGASSYAQEIWQLNQRANLPMELARQTGFVPLRRGFFKPIYNVANVSPTLSNEDEVASLLASPTERFAPYEISSVIERIASRRIQPQAQIGTSTFSIDSIPIGKGVPASIVNEGFGINQLVYMLTICLYSRYKMVAIEEPEIHLHPSMVRELAIALAEIAVEKDRRLIVSTHSETFVVALLSQIAAGKISPGDVSFVLAENPNGSTVLIQQKANRNGQIEGGLRAFMASEAKDLVDFLGLSSE